MTNKKKWWVWVLLFLTVAYYAVFGVQFRRTLQFCDESAPAANSICDGKYSLRYMLEFTVPALLFISFLADLFLFEDNLNLQLMRVFFYGVDIVFIIWSMALYAADMIAANEIGTGSSRCSDLLACCVPAIRAWISPDNFCRNKNLTTECVSPKDFKDLSVNGWCIAEFIYLAVLLVGVILILGFSALMHLVAFFSSSSSSSQQHQTTKKSTIKNK